MSNNPQEILIRKPNKQSIQNKRIYNTKENIGGPLC